jgi:hypothetical protein
MGVSAGFGIADLIGSIIAPAAAAEAVAAPAEVAGAIALPEIAVTAAAPEAAAAFGGATVAETLAGTGIGLGGAGLGAAEAAGAFGGGIGEAATTAGMFGAQAGAGLDLAGGAFGAPGAADLAQGGISTAPETFGGGGAGAAISPGGGGLLSAQEALAGGPTGPLATLSQPDFPGTFGQFGQTAPDISGPTAQDTALSFAPTDTSVTPANPLADIPAGPDPFATAPPAVEGQIPGQVANALTTGGGEFPPTAAQEPALNMAALNPPITPSIPASTPVAPTAVGYAPGSPEAAIAGSTGAAPGGLTTGAGGGGITGALSSVLSSPWTKAAELALPLGMLGYNLLKGPAPLPPAEQQALQNIGGAQALGNQYLKMAANNQLTPAQYAEIQIFTQNSTNALYQRIANSGQDPNSSSDYALGVQQIQQQAIAMKQQFINAMVTSGTQAIGLADGVLQSAANMQVANDNAFNTAVASSLQAFALMGVLSSAKAA